MACQRLCATALLLILPAWFSGQAQETKVELVPVKYAGLKQEVLQHRGKVVVVDFWTGT